MHREISRRAILAGGTALLAAAQSDRQAQRKLKVAIFSKHLQFLQGEGLAKGAADIGFDGVDITVRRGGHVEPEMGRLPVRSGPAIWVTTRSDEGSHRQKLCVPASAGLRKW